MIVVVLLKDGGWWSRTSDLELDGRLLEQDQRLKEEDQRLLEQDQ